MPSDAIGPPPDSVDEFGNVWRWSAGRATFVHGPDAAPHFYTRRPIHLCADGRDDDDDGPPNWSDRDAE